jgi:hypothetical protein
METLWDATQKPDVHERWDLRFTEIRYLPRATETEAQRFLYATRIGFGLRVAGEGESVGQAERDGDRTSALRFWSEDRKSLIRAGSGYWRYAPSAAGVRFITQYNYETRSASPGDSSISSFARCSAGRRRGASIDFDSGSSRASTPGPRSTAASSTGSAGRPSASFGFITGSSPSSSRTRARSIWPLGPECRLPSRRLSSWRLRPSRSRSVWGYSSCVTRVHCCC